MRQTTIAHHIRICSIPLLPRRRMTDTPWMYRLKTVPAQMKLHQPSTTDYTLIPHWITQQFTPKTPSKAPHCCASYSCSSARRKTHCQTWNSQHPGPATTLSTLVHYATCKPSCLEAVRCVFAKASS